MMATNGIELVCFDLGGVFVRICSGWRETFAQAGVAPPASMDDPQVVAAITRSLVAYETGQIGCERFFPSYSRIAGLDEAVARACFEAWLIEPFAGIDSVIDRVSQQGIRTACLSNTNANHVALMTSDTRVRLPLHRLDWRFFSHETQVAKPHPAIYEHVERTTGVDPSQSPGAILFFDDRSENCEAARDRGWRTHQIDPSGDPGQQMLTHLTELGVG